MRIGVTYPVYISCDQHWQYLGEMLASLNSRHELLLIPIVNFLDARYERSELVPLGQEGVILDGRQPQSVAKAWNDGIAKGQELGCAYTLVVNTDIVLKPDSIDRLVAFAEAHPEACLWTMGEFKDREAFEKAGPSETFGENPHFSAFMVRADFFDEVGRFDENFRAGYYEDNDLCTRLVLAGKKALIYWGAIFFHYGSVTIRSDQAVANANNISFENNRRYFIEKWGCLPGEGPSYYKHPYNEADKPLSYWRP